MADPVVTPIAATAGLSAVSSLLGGAGSLLGGISSFAPTTTTTSKSGTSKTQRVFDQAAIDKLVYDVLSADSGLASLASGENLSGGFNSSAKTLQTQDFLTKLIGELAVASAPQVTESTETSRSKSKKTVICTELRDQGYLPDELYQAGGGPSRQVSYHTWVGYHIWAIRVVAKMKKSERLCKFLAPIVLSRYRYLTGVPGFHFLGLLTIVIGHPVCALIGHVVELGGKYGHSVEYS